MHRSNGIIVYVVIMGTGVRGGRFGNRGGVVIGFENELQPHVPPQKRGNMGLSRMRADSIGCLNNWMLELNSLSHYRGAAIRRYFQEHNEAV